MSTQVKTWDFTATGSGGYQGPLDCTTMTCQLKAEATSGAVNAAGVIEVTNTPGDANSWQTLATLSATGTPAAVDSAVAQASWPYARARCTTLTGTGAAATFSLSVRG